MSGQPVGTMFAEMDLDLTKLEKGLKEAYKRTVAGTEKFEQQFKALGIKSDRMFESQKQMAIASNNAILASTKATANDRARAEKAMHDKIAQLNKEQFGKHESLITRAKNNWMGLIATFYLVQRAASVMSTPFIKGFEAVETYSQSVASLAAMVVTFSERQKGMTLESQWKGALEYSTAMVPVLENLAARTLLSGQETTALANAFARSGVFLDANNEKQIESFTRISNALPLMTQGQEIMRQINTEIRGLMTGTNESTNMMLTTLKAIDPEIKEHLKTWRAEGTVLEHVGELLVGFGPATEMLENQWQAVKSTIDTTATQILRGLMKPAYESIIESTKELNGWLVNNKQEILDWGTSFRLVAISIEAEIMRLAMFIDRIGGTMTQMKMLASGPGMMLGLDASTKNFDAARIQNEVFEQRYKNTEKALERLALKYNELEYSISAAGKAAAATSSAMPSPPKGRVAGPTEEEIEKAAREEDKKIKKAVDEIKRWEKIMQEKSEAIGSVALLNNQEYISKFAPAEPQTGDVFLKKYLADVEKLEKAEQEKSEMLGQMAMVDQKAAESSAKDRADAYRTMYSDMKGQEKEYYVVQLNALNKERQNYENLTGDKVTADKWYLDQKKKLDQDLALSSNKFFKGIEVGYDRMLDDQMTWAKGGLAIFNSFAKGGQSTISNVLFDGIKGELKSFEDYWDSFFDGLLRTFTDTVAEMATQQASKAAVSGLASIGGWAGGVAVDWLSGSGAGDAVLDWMGGDWDWLASLHSGTQFVGMDMSAADRLKQDEYLSKLQKGEIVVPRGISDDVRSGDYSSFAGWMGGSIAGTALAGGYGATSVSNSVGKNLGSQLESALGTKGFMALSAYGMGASLSQVADMALQGSLSSVISSAWGAVTEATLDAFGAKSSTLSKVGGFVGAGAGGVVGGIGGSIVGAILGQVLGAIADMFAVPVANFFGFDTSNMSARSGFSLSGLATSYGSPFESMNLDVAKTLGHVAPDVEAALQSMAQNQEAHLSVGDLGSYGGFSPVGMTDFEGGIGMGPGTSSGADPAGIGPGTGFGFRYGGISRGPESGYTARLHGTELIVSEKRDVPVKISGSSDGGNLPPVQVNVVIDRRVLASVLYKQSKAGVKIIHDRGLTNV